MANNSLLAADGQNPKASIHGLADGGERSAFNQVVCHLTYLDIPTSADSYVLAKIPVGAAIVRCIWIVKTAFSNLVDIGVSTSAGVAGTDGNLDVLLDGSAQANNLINTVVIMGGEKASGKNCGLLTSTTYVSVLGHMCTTDSYIVVTPAGTQSAGEGTLIVEYYNTLN